MSWDESAWSNNENNETGKDLDFVDPYSMNSESKTSQDHSKIWLKMLSNIIFDLKVPPEGAFRPTYWLRQLKAGLSRIHFESYKKYYKTIASLEKQRYAILLKMKFLKLNLRID